MRSKFIVLAAGIAAASTSLQVQAVNFGDFMSPGKWFGNNNRDRDYYYGPGYGYPGYGYGYPGYGYGYPGYGYGYGNPGYGYGYPGYGYPAQGTGTAPAPERAPQ